MKKNELKPLNSFKSSFRQLHILPDYFSIPDLKRLALSVAYASVVVGLLHWHEGDERGGLVHVADVHDNARGRAHRR